MDNTEKFAAWEERKAVALEAYEVALKALGLIREGGGKMEATVARDALERIDEITP